MSCIQDKLMVIIMRLISTFLFLVLILNGTLHYPSKAHALEDCIIAVAGSDVIFLIYQTNGEFELLDQLDMMGLVEWNEDRLLIYDLETSTLWQYVDNSLSKFYDPVFQGIISEKSFLSPNDQFLITYHSVPNDHFFIQDVTDNSNRTPFDLPVTELGSPFSWSPDGRLIATITIDSSGERQIIVVDTSDGQVVQRYTIEVPDSLIGSRSNVTPELVWSTEGNYLALASFIYVWPTIPVNPIVIDIENNRLMPLDLGSQFYIVDWTSDNTLVYGSANQIISVEVDHPDIQTVIVDFQDEVYTVDGARLSPQAQYVAYLYIENSRTSLYVRDMETEEDLPFVSDLFIRDIAWHPSC